MPEEKKRSSQPLDKTIDALFSEFPSAPVAHTELKKGDMNKILSNAEKTTDSDGAGSQRVAQAAPGNPVQAKAPAAPKAPAQQKPRQTITMSDLQKLVNAPKPTKPLEKAPVWSTILVVCSMILSMIVMVMSFVAAYFYFSGAIMSQILAVLFGIVVVLFVLGCALMLCKIEKGIREIKTKL